MVDPTLVGHAFAPFTWAIEPGRVSLFAKAIGERGALFTDAETAKAAGYRDVLVPPTLLGIAAEPCPDDYIALIGVDPGAILHAEQALEYHAPICAGDQLYGQKRITEILQKKNGALTFVQLEVEYRNPDGVLVCTSRQTIVVRRGETA
ncbi:MAG: MaoC family dehydratase N-terminal domain-containing protein [Sinimarinibacterium sp.]|jgi:acyl dehydratase